MRAFLCALLLVGPASALAQNDEAIPYPDDDATDAPKAKKLPRRSEETHTRREETEDEEKEREAPLSNLDDPNLGLGGEFLAGLLFPDSAKGGFPEAKPAWGFRFTWEVGRITGNEALREALFGDVTWAYGSMRSGTNAVYGDTHLHYFTVAPAWTLLVNQARTLGFYGQVGFGIAYQATQITVNDVHTDVNGVKPLFQYGLGFRGTPTIADSIPLRLSFRVEVTRFRRGYLDDTYAGGGVGLDF